MRCLPSLPRLGAAALLACGAAACGEAGPHEITEVREVDRLPPRARTRLSTAERFGMARRGGGEQAASQKPGYAWELPAGWEAVPVGPMQMRDASFRAPGGVDVSVLVGRPSPLLANVNRWRGQMGADTVGAAALDALAYEVPAGPGLLVDLEGTFTPRRGDPQPGQRFVGFLLLADDHLLSVRMLGSEEAVDAAEGAFRAFLASLERKAAPAPTGPDPGAPDTRDGLRDRLAWDVPEGWSAERAASGMRVASFRIEGAPRLDVPLIAMHGDGGGLEPILAMWARGVGREDPSPDEAAAFERFDLLGGEAVLVEMRGTRELDGEQADVTLLGLVCFLEDRSLFLRMQGRTEDVEPYKDAFVALGRSLRWVE